ncbi:MAG TPA: PIG-L family deacetylase [Bellilinea sp.]|nr:PIG-L family deacetylase [Bellilinea sp.]
MPSSQTNIPAVVSPTKMIPPAATPRRPVLLAVLAHPDDETFGMGGTFALYSRRGVDTYLICATRGEAGDVDPELLRGYDSIAERREAELRCAAVHLGMTDVILLDYRDSGMPGSADNHHPLALVAQPREQLALELARHIRRLKPDVLVTFDPIGGYHHPDHIAIHQATVRAFDLAGDPAAANMDGLPAHTPSKLYYQTIPRRYMRLMMRILTLIGRDPHKFGKNKDIDLAAIAEVDFPTNAVIDYRAVADIRDEAASCHASQVSGSFTVGVFAHLRRLLASKEIYMRAVPPPNGKVERDLFEDLVKLPPLQRM